LTPGTHVVDLWIGKSRWTTTGGQGIVRNIYFKNVSATLKPGAPFPLSRIVGFDASHTIDTVTFENFTVDGKVVISTADAHITTNSANYFTNVTFRAPGP
jgi:hypothetical protein